MPLHAREVVENLGDCVDSLELNDSQLVVFLETTNCVERGRMCDEFMGDSLIRAAPLRSFVVALRCIVGKRIRV